MLSLVHSPDSIWQLSGAYISLLFWGHAQKYNWPSISHKLKRHLHIPQEKYIRAKLTFGLLATQTGTTRSHLDTCSCPTCILLMARSTINKACGHLLKAAWPALSPDLALQYAWGFWHALQSFSSMNNGWEGVRKTYSSYMTNSCTMRGQRVMGLNAS